LGDLFLPRRRVLSSVLAHLSYLGRFMRHRQVNMLTMVAVHRIHSPSPQPASRGGTTISRRQGNLILWNCYLINHDLFLIDPSLATLPSPLARAWIVNPPTG